MKKLILAAIFFFTGLLPAATQYYYAPSYGIEFRPVEFKFGVYGGANLSETSPLAGGFFAVEGYDLMLEIDCGWNRQGVSKHDFFYVNPNIGFSIGGNLRFFGLIGITNWGAINTVTEKFYSDKMWPVIKLGLNFYWTRHWFLTASWRYIIDCKHKDIVLYDDNALTVGFGYRF